MLFYGLSAEETGVDDSRLFFASDVPALREVSIRRDSVKQLPGKIERFFS